MKVSFFEIFLVLGCSWWIILYLLLPWRVEKPHAIHPGCDQGAPQNAYIGLKIKMTTLFSIFFVLFYVSMKFFWPTVKLFLKDFIRL